MADGTRQTQVDLNAKPGDKAFKGEQWSEAGPTHVRAPENANLMAGGTEHTAGGKVGDVTLGDAVKSIKREDWDKFAEKPCVRDSLMSGIGAGAAMGAIRAIWKAPVWTACSWAVGTFCFGSFAMYQYCNFQRVAEKEGMKRAMEIMDRKQMDRKQREARMERARELRRQKKEEEQDQHFAKLRTGTDATGDAGPSGKPWWKVW